ncbi:MAG: hypothetical protein AAI946_00345 [Candidatus Hodgkinia cicadicola]
MPRTLFALGSANAPRVPSIKLFEYCAKDSARFYNKLCLLTVSRKLINFRITLAHLPVAVTALASLTKLRRFAPFLKLPTTYVYSVFRCYGITEPLCLCSDCKPKYSVYSAERLVRVSKLARFVFLKGIGFKLPALNRFAFGKKRVIAYFGCLASIWSLLANSVTYGYGLTAELARVRLALICFEPKLLCSGDCGFYSVLSLFWQCVNVANCCEVIAIPNVSSVQYLNVVLGSVLSLSSSTVSLSSAFGWVSLKRFIVLCITSGVVCAVYNPKARYRQRLLTYIANRSAIDYMRCVLAMGKRLCTRFECIDTTFVSNISLAAVGMLTIVVVCANLVLLIKHRNALNCIS